MKTYNIKEKIILLTIIIILVFFSVVFADGPEDCTNISTTEGKISGLINKNICVYKGIPYSEPPVGNLRFAKPIPPEVRDKTFIADTFGNECLQYPLFGLFPTKKITGDEDCLYLNIWQPTSSAKSLKPVMVFLHGGGFAFGSGSFDLYEGTKISTQGDVIVATLNYRLGPMGFLSHPSLKDERGEVGNYGIYDQIEALRWIKRNIKNFGGDLDNITIFGESAGGMSIGVLITSPLTRGLFNKAIIQSGPLSLITTTLKSQDKVSVEFAEKVGCENLKNAGECLRSLSSQNIYKYAQSDWSHFTPEDNNPQAEKNFFFSPIIDGKLIPDNPLKLLAKGIQEKNLKVIVGSNKDEVAIIGTRAGKVNTWEDLKLKTEQYANLAKKELGLEIDPGKFSSLYFKDKYPDPQQAFKEMIGDIIFTCPTILTAKYLTNNQGDAYLYQFAKTLSSKPFLKDMGAFHGSELPFVFGKFKLMGFNVTTEDNVEVSDKVISLWTSFAHYGIPSAKDVPQWEKFNPKHTPYLVIDSSLEVKYNLKAEECDYFEKVFGSAK